MDNTNRTTHSINPFVDYNKYTEHTTIPKFPKKVVSVRISAEAISGLEVLSTKYTTQQSIASLMERIGLYALQIRVPEFVKDDKSNVTTDDCRESGYEDGLHGNPDFFLQMFGQTLTSEFQESYMRGFFEGNYIRQTRNGK